ncbi:hypothetical protein KEM48_011159 [Puccinia striiformis f. sp. tritici PST-130]|nr:hypothetical protein Pst134EB_026434 [Puccinia striiformis f. sp. tritici]KAI9629088.1 hypothetical protein KEM48_011159 [Puccinia striiformis f. sp. tritici PST-130]
MNHSNFFRASTCAPNFSNGPNASTHAENPTSFVSHDLVVPNHDQNRLNAIEEENRKLKAELESLKSLFHNVTLNKSDSNNSTNSTPPSKKSKSKSLTPQSLKKKTNSSNHDLEAIELDHISRKLLSTCYDLARCLMNRENATALVPDPPSVLKRRKIEGYFGVSPNAPSDSAGIRIQQRDLVAISSTPKIDQDYIDYIHGTMRRWGITRFTMDWNRHYDDRFNQIMCQFFIRVWKWGLAFGRFGPLVQNEAASLDMDELILMAIYWRHSKSLRRYYKRGQKGDETLASDQAKNTQRQSLKRKSVLRQLYLQQQGVHISFIEPFDDKDANSDDEITVVNDTPVASPKSPFWRSQRATEFIDWIEAKRRSQRISTTTLNKKMTYGVKATLRPRHRPNPPIPDPDALIPTGRPEDWYRPEFLATLTFADRKKLEVRPPIFNSIGDFDYILPQTEENFHKYPDVPHIDTINGNSSESDECEFEENANPMIKIEEDEEML